MATGRERVQAALALDVADRPPVSAWGHTYDAEWDVEALATATVAQARQHGLDFVKLQIRASTFAEAFGARWRYSGVPESEPLLELAGGVSRDEWRRIVQGPSDPAVLADQVEVVRRVVGELGADVPVIQTVFSPGMVAWFLAGRDTALLSRLMRDEPALMAAGLERIAGALARFTSDSLAAGAAGVFYAINPLAGTTLVAPDEYEALYLPSDRIAAAAAAEGWFNMLHLCGGHINERLGRELDMQCVNWAAEEPGNPALADLRDRLRVAVAGGVTRYSPIQYADPGEMLRAAGAALAETGGRGHLLTPGCSSSPWGKVRPANLRALAAAAGLRHPN
jgi:uroporphyrinogen decarboxylase